MSDQERSTSCWEIGMQKQNRNWSTQSLASMVFATEMIELKEWWTFAGFQNQSLRTRYSNNHIEDYTHGRGIQIFIVIK